MWFRPPSAALLLALLLALGMTAVDGRPTVRELRDKREFDKLIKHHADTTGLPVIVDFFSESCGPCRMIAPAFKALAKEHTGRAVFAKVDVNRNSQTSQAMGVRSMPTFMAFVNGKKINEFSGAGEQQLRQMTTEAVREASRVNVQLPEATLAAFYAQHEPSKSEADVQELWKKCAKGADTTAKASSFRLAKPGACVGGAADELARKLRQKYSAKPKLGKRFEPEAAAPSSSPAPAPAPRHSRTPAPTRRASTPTPAPAEPNLHLASVDDLQSELARRGLTVKVEIPEEDGAFDEDEEDEYDDEEEEDGKALWHPSPFPERLAVIGAGPAGLAAAIYAARAGLRPVVIAPPFGGQLQGKGVDVENYPGLTGMTGPTMVQMMLKQAQDFGAVFVEEPVASVNLTQRPLALRTESHTIHTHAAIIATGADARWLAVENEWALRGGGVSTCATCDGFVYRDRPVVVVGGGDAAMEDALVLARTSSSVVLVHRRDSFRASKALADRVLQHDKIQVRWNTTVKAFIGENIEPPSDEDRPRLTGVVLARTDGLGEEEELACEGAFVAIGHIPNTGLFEQQLQFAHNGYLATFNGSTATSVPGVFAAGDVADDIYRQAITSAGSGAMASLDAERWLSTNGFGDEEEEFTDDLMAELLADFADSSTGQSGLNAYDEELGSLVGRKESMDKDADAHSLDSEAELLRWASSSTVSGEL